MTALTLECTDKMPVANFFNGPMVDVTDGLTNALGGK